MKTERELFEVEMEKLIGKVLSIKYSEEEGGYVAHKLMISDESTKMIVNVFNFSWAMWQASASREGYKLVPVVDSDAMWSAGMVIIEENGYCTDASNVYKAMIEAA